MDGRKPKRIGEIGLGHRKLIVAISCSPDGRESLAHFQDEMGKALRRLSPADVDNPLAKDCRIDERLAPQRFGDQRAGAGQGTQTVMRDEPDRAGREATELVVHHMKMKALKVRSVACDVDGKDLALAAVPDLGPDAVTIDHEAAVRGFVSLADYGGIRRELLYLEGQSSDGVDVVCIQVGINPQLTDHRLKM